MADFVVIDNFEAFVAVKSYWRIVVEKIVAAFAWVLLQVHGPVLVLGKEPIRNFIIKKIDYFKLFKICHTGTCTGHGTGKGCGTF